MIQTKKRSPSTKPTVGQLTTSVGQSISTGRITNTIYWCLTLSPVSVQYIRWTKATPLNGPESAHRALPLSMYGKHHSAMSVGITLVFLIADQVPNNHPGYQNSGFSVAMALLFIYYCWERKVGHKIKIWASYTLWCGNEKAYVKENVPNSHRGCY